MSLGMNELPYQMKKVVQRICMKFHRFSKTVKHQGK